MMRKTSVGLLIMLYFMILPLSAPAADDNVYNLPWERYNLQAGVFYAALDDKVRVGTEGGGVIIDVEQVLGLKPHNTVFRIGGSYRIGEERRHRVDLEYFYFNRNSSKVIGQDITVGDNVTIAAGANVNTTFNFQIVKATYSYSFFQDDRMDLAVSAGLFVMPIKFDVAASGVNGRSGSLKFTAPLPVVGLRGDFAITRRWFLRTKLEIFYLEYQNFRGGLMDTNVAVEYNRWKNFGIGAGLENFRIRLQAEGGENPLVDFNGEVKMQYIGAQLYARYFF